MIDPIEVGKRLRALREMRGLSVREIASAIGLTPSVVYRYECGTVRPGRDALLGLSLVLDAPLEHILHGMQLPGCEEPVVRADGCAIRVTRKTAGMTQAELADQLKVARNTVGAWERGTANPSLQELRMLARVLGTSVSSLTGAESVSGHGMSLMYAPVADSLRSFCNSDRLQQLAPRPWELAVFAIAATQVSEPQSIAGWASLLRRVQLELDEVGHDMDPG